MLQNPVIAYIGIGSNIGNRRLNCLKSIEHIKRIECVKFLRASGLYRTEPVGIGVTRWFVNCVAEIATNRTPEELIRYLEDAEQIMGRKNKGLKKNRIIDLDILFYGDRVINTKKLTIPHPQAHLRGFVLIPMAEIAPDLVHPVFRKSISVLLQELLASHRNGNKEALVVRMKNEV